MSVSIMLAAIILMTSFAASMSSSAPNFVVIIADDLGYNDIGAYGSATIRTPALDRMAREGMKFTQFYAAAAICTPSRGAFLTGRLPVRSGLFTKMEYPIDLAFRVFYPSSVGCLPLSEHTIGQILKGAGYTTSLIGKWHLGHNPKVGCLPLDRGFDSFFGLPYSHEEGYPGPTPEDLIWPPMPLIRGRTIIQQPVDLESLTPRYITETLSLLDTYASTKQPFFMHVAFEEPHVPLFAAPRFQNTSRRGPFGDAVEQMDDAVGRILDKLRSTGLASNTLVIFTSDNGAWNNPNSGIPGSKSDPLAGGSNAPFRDGKGSTWEGGIREPAIAWWPGRIAAGQTSLEMTSMMDIFPTFLDLAGVKAPSNWTIDGSSIAPLLLGQNSSSPHDFLYHWREHTLYAIRYGPWKAHFVTRPGFKPEAPVVHNPPLLFNVEFDPAENYAVNTTGDPQAAAALTRIIAAYHDHIKQVVPGQPQYEPQDWTLVPCCHGPFNSTDWQEFIRKREWSLALWELFGCVCR